MTFPKSYILPPIHSDKYTDLQKINNSAVKYRDLVFRSFKSVPHPAVEGEGFKNSTATFCSVKQLANYKFAMTNIKMHIVQCFPDHIVKTESHFQIILKICGYGCTEIKKNGNEKSGTLLR